MFSKRMARGSLDRKPVFLDSLIATPNGVVIMAMFAGNDLHLRKVGDKITGNAGNIKMRDDNYGSCRISALETYGVHVHSCGSAVYPHASTMLLWQRALFERGFPGQKEVWSLLPPSESARDTAWENIKALSPVPLLETWRGRLMAELEGAGNGRSGIVIQTERDIRPLIRRGSPAWRAYRVIWAGKEGPRIFAAKISDLLRGGELPLPDDADYPAPPLEGAGTSAPLPGDFAKRQGYNGPVHESTSFNLEDLD